MLHWVEGGSAREVARKPWDYARGNGDRQEGEVRERLRRRFAPLLRSLLNSVFNHMQELFRYLTQHRIRVIYEPARSM